MGLRTLIANGLATSALLLGSTAPRAEASPLTGHRVQVRPGSGGVLGVLDRLVPKDPGPALLHSVEGTWPWSAFIPAATGAPHPRAPIVVGRGHWRAAGDGSYHPAAAAPAASPAVPLPPVRAAAQVLQSPGASTSPDPAAGAVLATPIPEPATLAMPAVLAAAFMARGAAGRWRRR